MEKAKKWEGESSSREVLVGPSSHFGVVSYPSPVPLDGSDCCAKWSTPSRAAVRPVASAGDGESWWRWGMCSPLPTQPCLVGGSLGSCSCLAWHRAAVCHWHKGAGPLGEHREANLLLSALGHRSLLGLLAGLVFFSAAQPVSMGWGSCPGVGTHPFDGKAGLGGHRGGISALGGRA